MFTGAYLFLLEMEPRRNSGKAHPPRNEGSLEVISWLSCDLLVIFHELTCVNKFVREPLTSLHHVLLTSSIKTSSHARLSRAGHSNLPRACLGASYEPPEGTPTSHPRGLPRASLGDSHVRVLRSTLLWPVGRIRP